MTKEQARKMLKDFDVGCLDFKGTCHDCKKEMIVSIIKDDSEDGFYVEGGAVYQKNEVYKPEEIALKCHECFDADRTLRNECEVFSRVVGYYRPVKGYNPGKSAEFKDRKMFKL